MLQRKELDAVALAEYFIDRIAAYSDKAVFTATCFERARREAAQSAARHAAGKALGLLDGVPVAWKDLIDIEGTPTTAASQVYRHAAPASKDAAVVRNLAAAGMVTLGKTNLSEFAYSALGLNPHFGTPRNPRSHDVARVPGGSSSGSAVAVAAGLVPIAIGTDTGGSVRVPAAFNGVVGFKPSEGRHDKTGVFPLSVTLDTIGVFANEAIDCRLVDQALCGLPVGLHLAGGQPLLSSLSVVVPENVVMDDLEAAVRSNFLDSLDRLAHDGVKVVWRALPQLDELQELVRRHGALAASEAYVWHKALLESERYSEVDPFVAKRIMGGKRMSDADVSALQLGRRRLQQSLWEPLGDVLIAMPTVAHVAPPLAPLEASLDYFTQVNMKTIRNTNIGNLLNLCGLALSNGVGQAGMPTSILFNAQGGREDHLLSVAGALSQCVHRPGRSHSGAES
jgi:aspartyl-tRNA(Asn)/glutamyl-tRNA(Gln) amidotransferase subunit A